MFQKAKTTKKVMALLLSLVMLLSLIPAVSLTAFAATIYTSGTVDISQLEVGDAIGTGVQSLVAYEAEDGYSVTLVSNGFGYCLYEDYYQLVTTGSPSLSSNDFSGGNFLYYDREYVPMYESESGSVQSDYWYVIAIDHEEHTMALSGDPSAKVYTEEIIGTEINYDITENTTYNDDCTTTENGINNGVEIGDTYDENNRVIVTINGNLYVNKYLYVHNGSYVIVNGDLTFNRYSLLGCYDNAKVIYTGTVTDNSDIGITSYYIVKPNISGNVTYHAASGDNPEYFTFGTSDTKYFFNGSEFLPINSIALDKTSADLTVGENVALTATITPSIATDKTVKWSTTGGVTLYSDENCTAGNEIGADATSTLTVYAKGTAAGSATVTATSNADSTKSASCNVTVNKTDPEPTSTVSFTKVTSVDQISADNIGECTFEDATAWILDNWDDIINTTNEINVVYYKGQDLYIIFLNPSTEKEDFEDYHTEDTYSINSLINWYNGGYDDVWICTSAAAASTVTFGKVTDASQITADNIASCTVAEAAAWIVDNWDDIDRPSGDMVFVYFIFVNEDENNALYYGCLSQEDSKSEFESNPTDYFFALEGLDNVITWIEEYGDVAYLCGLGESGSEPAPPTYTWTSGDCTVTYDPDTDTMTVSKNDGDGNGKMADYTSNSDGNPAPWASVLENVTTVVISDGVTGVGDYAFYDSTTLDKLTIPGSVTSIGTRAFYSSNASNLTVSFVRPTSQSTLTVGDNAFNYYAKHVYSGDGKYTLFNGDSEIELTGAYDYKGDKLNGKSLTWKIPTFAITDASVNGTVTASVNGTVVTEAEADDTVLLTVDPANGYQFKSITATSPKDSPEEFSDLVDLMGTAVFDGAEDDWVSFGGYTCKVVNGGFEVSYGTTIITEAAASDVTDFSISSPTLYCFSCGDIGWNFVVNEGKITFISIYDNSNWTELFEGEGTSNGALVPAEIELTTVTEGSEYTFTMPKKAVTVKAEFEAAAHAHDFTYSASGATITAECTVDGCDLTDNKVTLTIVAPTLTVYGGTGSAAATLDGLDAFNAATGLNVDADSIVYWKAKIIEGVYKTDGNEPLAGAPTNAGNYLAKITVSNCIASVGYTIAKADPSYTVPTGLTATYGDQLSSVILPEGWAWANGDQPVGNAGANTFKATFTPADTDNYNVITDIDVTVTVDKADAVPATVTANELSFDCTEQALVTVTGEAVGGEMRFALGEDAENAPEDGWSADVPAATKYGTYYVWYKVVADDNHNGTAPECVEVTIFNDTSAIAGTYVSENALVVNGYEDVMMGDVDGSGIVDVTDYLMVKRHVLGTYELSDVQFLAADVDFSGTIDSRDYLMIKRNVLGTYDLPGVPTVTMTITLNVGAEGTGEMITTVEGYENELVTLIDPIEMNESGTWTIYVHLIANVEGVPQEEIMELTLELTEDGCRLLGTNGSRVEFVRVEGVDE